MTATQQQMIAHYVAELYKVHYGWLYGWLYQKLGSVENAEDIVQDTFIRLIRSQDLLSIQQPKAYLTTTAKRILIDRARHQKIEHAYLEYLSRQETCHDISPEHIVMAIDALDKLALALHRLPARVQQAFLWHYVDGESLVMIAQRLGVTPKTVHSDLVKALAHSYRVLRLEA